MKKTLFQEFCVLEVLLPLFLLVTGAFIAPYEHNFYNSYLKFLNHPIWYVFAIGFCAYVFPRLGFLQMKTNPTQFQQKFLYIMTCATAILGFYILK